jgi:hypothetical protein
VEAFSGLRRFWASCLWPLESRFPETETVVGRDAVRTSLLCNQTQHLTLTRPFDGEVAEPGHAHSVGEPPIDRRLDEVRCEERERDRHVDLPRGAVLTFGDAFGIRSGIGDELVDERRWSTSRQRRPCTATWICGSGWRRLGMRSRSALLIQRGQTRHADTSRRAYRLCRRSCRCPVRRCPARVRPVGQEAGADHSTLEPHTGFQRRRWRSPPSRARRRCPN